MFDRVWNIKSDYRDESVRKLSSETGLPLFMCDTLLERGFDTGEKINDFLYGDVEKMHDPFLFTDMEKAVERLLAAVHRNETITVYGDYDADGINATAIVYRFFTDVMEYGNIGWYIPDRFNDGYGLSNKTIDILKERGTDVVLTVDCGITSDKEAEYIKKLGMELIITDHHRPGDVIPDAYAVIDPSCSDSGYPFAGLCGAGVALKLVQALVAKIDKTCVPDTYIVFATIATIGDSVPLVDENRIIVKNGLNLMAKQDFNLVPGLSKLFEVSDKVRSLNSQGIAYGVVPTLNAAGRMGSGERALRLLLSQDENEINELTLELIEENKNRQAVEAEVTAEALKPDNIVTTPMDSIVLSIGRGWHAGVIGIVASKLVERFNKPAIVCLYDEDGETVHGSARSVPGFNLHEALTTASDLMERFGGHKMAAGISIRAENLDELVKRINKYAGEHEIPAYTLPSLDTECVIPLSEITLENADRIKVIEPCGEGNKEPVYVAEDIQLVNCRAVGAEGNHLSVQFTAGGRALSGIAFSQGKFLPVVSLIKNCDVAFKLSVNEWNGNRYVSLIVLDIREHGEYNITCSRERLASLYSLIRKNYAGGFSYYGIAKLYEAMSAKNEHYTVFELFRGLEIFEELDFIRKKGDEYEFITNPENRALDNSPIYKALCSYESVSGGGESDE